MLCAYNMDNKIFILICFCLISTTRAKTESQLRDWFIEQAIECNKEHKITPEEIAVIRAQQIPSSINAKCLMACVFRKANWINSLGLFDLDASLEMIKKELDGDEEKTEKAKKLFESCQHVNESVIDNVDGCERAAQLSKCLVDNIKPNGDA